MVQLVVCHNVNNIITKNLGLSIKLLTVQTGAESWWIFISVLLFLANATIASFPANVPCAPSSFTA